MESVTDDIPFLKLTKRSDDSDGNPVEVMDSLILLPEAAAGIPVIKNPEAETEASVTDTTDMAKSGNNTDMHYEMLSEQELQMQREEEKYAFLSAY